MIDGAVYEELREQLSAALKRVRLAKQFEQLNGTGPAFAAVRAIEDLRRYIIDYFASTFEADRVYLVPYNAITREFEPPVSTGDAPIEVTDGDKMILSNLMAAEECFQDPQLSDLSFLAGTPVSYIGCIRFLILTEVLAFLFVVHDTRHFFTKDETDALHLVAVQATIALHSSRMCEAYELQINQLYETIRQLESVIQTGENLPPSDWEAPTAVVRSKLREILGEDNDLVTFYPRDCETGLLQHPYLEGKYKNFFLAQGMDPYREKAVYNRRMKLDEDAYYTDDAGDDYLMRGEFVKREGITASASLKIKTADETEEVLGLLFVNRRDGRTFDKEDRSALESAVVKLGNALRDEQHLLHAPERLQKRINEQTRMLRVSHVIGYLVGGVSLMEVWLAISRDDVPSPWSYFGVVVSIAAGAGLVKFVFGRISRSMYKGARDGDGGLAP